MVVDAKYWYRQTAKPMLLYTYRGEPLTKSNHTFFGKGRAYIPAKHRKYEADLQKAVQAAMKKAKKKVTNSLVVMEIWYYVGSKRRKDLPNLPKTTTDALNEVLYEDDFQIHDMILHRRLDRDDPRVEIAIWKVKDKSWVEG